MGQRQLWGRGGVLEYVSVGDDLSTECTKVAANGWLRAGAGEDVLWLAEEKQPRRAWEDLTWCPAPMLQAKEMGTEEQMQERADAVARMGRYRGKCTEKRGQTAESKCEEQRDAGEGGTSVQEREECEPE